MAAIVASSGCVSAPAEPTGPTATPNTIVSNNGRPQHVPVLHELPPGERRGTFAESVGTDDLGIDCTAIRAAIAQKRSNQNFAVDADAEANRLLSEAPHYWVPADTLVDFMMIRDGYGRPTDPTAESQHKTILKMMLCDRLTREIVSRQYASTHPTYRL